ncbi:uncharacterized protein LOC143029084 [Oratosquilla oratoria]|uniref:uncharacterized protein LOC143029084 n=1 Tax=Oratosquilla oratoria TaxID=337810 RepID=UPI003F76A074
MERLIFFLGLLVFSDACGVFEDLDPGEGSAPSTRTPAPFPNAKAKLMVKPSSEGDIKLGLYLKDEMEEDVAGVTLHQINTSLFVSFYERRNGTLNKVFTRFVDKQEPLFKPGLLACVTVTHVDDVVTVDILPERYGYLTTVKGLVRTQHRLPLRIYAKALQGPVLSTFFHYPGDEDLSDTASAFLGDDRISVYIHPDQNFRFANIIMLMDGAHQIFNLTSDDLIPGQCNRFKYHVRRSNEEMWLQLYLPEKRRCTRFREERISRRIERSYLVANSPVQLIKAEGIRRYAYGSRLTFTDNYEMQRLSLPLCDSKEETKCLIQRIGVSNHSSELIHLRNRVDFAIQPRAIVSGRIINFGIWLQEFGNLLVGVHIVQEGDGDVQLRFYQVLNDSYKLRHMQTLGGVKLDPKNITFLFLTYTESEVEVGLKTSLKGEWYKSKAAVTLGNKLPISAFLWSKEDLMIAMNCPWEDFQFNMAMRANVTSSPERAYSEHYSGSVFFFPTSDFKAGTIASDADNQEIVHIKKADIIPDKWNQITRVYRDYRVITMPASKFCPVVLDVGYNRMRYIYTNPPTDWSFDKPPPELGEIVLSERCDLDGDNGCSKTSIGFKGMEYLNFVDGEVTIRRIKQHLYKGYLLLMSISDGPHRMASLHVIVGDNIYFLESEDLGFKSEMKKYEDWNLSGVSLTRKEDGRVEFTSRFSYRSEQRHVSFTSNKTLPAPTEGHSLAYTIVTRESLESVKVQYLAIDDSQTSVIFRSSSNWTTSLTFHLRDVAGSDEGTLLLVHGPSVKGIRLIYNGEGISPKNFDVPDVTVRSNQWVELTLQILERVLRVSLRTREEPTWRNFEFATERTDSRPLVAVIESQHHHDVILSCKRENGQFAVADDRIPISVLSAKATTTPQQQQQPKMAVVGLERTVTSGHIAAGQKHTFLARGYGSPSLVLLQFSHRNGGMSTLTFEKLPLVPGAVLEMYLDNTDQDEGISKVEVPDLGASLEVFDLKSPGPVDYVQVFSSGGSIWFFNSCGHVSRPVDEWRQFFDPEQGGVVEMAAFPGDSALYMWGDYLHYANVYFNHKNGNVTIRDFNLKGFSVHGTLLQLRNVLDEKSFASMTGTSGELEDLDYNGPVQNVTVVHGLTSDYCVVLLEACQAK